ncbi:MAG: cytochrome c [Actinomycetota bacterium]|nr:cytochrome c [Actinomycetota bacterium]
MTGSAKVWLLAFVVCAVVGFGALVGIGCGLGANACPFTTSKAITTTDGSELYARLCIGCHDVGGKGTGNGPSLVAGAAATYTLDELETKIARGKPLAGMPAWSKAAFGHPALTKAQIHSVAQYVLMLREAS